MPRLKSRRIYEVTCQTIISAALQVAAHRKGCTALPGGPKGAAKVRPLFVQAECEQTRLAMSFINWGEVFYVIAKTSGEDRTRRAFCRRDISTCRGRAFNRDRSTRSAA